MADRIGTDFAPLSGATGSVTSASGQTIISSDDTGGTSDIIGPALQKEIFTLVPNGDFAVAPQDAGSNISDDNTIPYWDYTTTTATAAYYADSGSASGQVLRITIPIGATTSSTSISRFLSVPGNRNREFAFIPEVSFGVPTAMTTLTMTVAWAWYGSDRTTLISSASRVKTYTASSTTTTLSAYDSTSGTNAIYLNLPSAAAYLKVTITAAYSGAALAAVRYVDLQEVRVNNGVQELWVAESTAPATYGPALIKAENGALSIRPSVTTPIASTPYLSIGSVAGAGVTLTTPGPNMPININASGASSYIYVKTTLGGGDIDIESNESLSLQGSSGVYITDLGGLGVNISGNLNVGRIYTGSGTGAFVEQYSTTTESIRIRNNANSAFGNIVLNRLFPGGQTTNYLSHDGTSFTMSSPLEMGNLSITGVNILEINDPGEGIHFTGNATTTTGWYVRQNDTGAGPLSWNSYNESTGALTERMSLSAAGQLTTSSNIVTNAGLFTNGAGLYHDTPTGTTATTNAGIWVLNAGTQYNLRRNTSSARYKTDIVDAGAQVLAASRRIRPRHFTSTIPDEAGATRLGFIAEEILEAGLDHGIGYNSEGLPETLDPVALLAAAFVRIADLEARLVNLEGIVNGSGHR
ncbi:hypothetical protein UFOVP613_38 [uncultured Caudovirales phage]|uniref:Peptidase S74 domain-containing protein n=1 Tax=uncultured Caudovirales phage TaxID=2100421 RepID=A0A6J5N3C5_9CAUD|nr:hypothetical protein UFOVP613_38 [uncultured Caudovirales phage]